MKIYKIAEKITADKSIDTCRIIVNIDRIGGDSIYNLIDIDMLFERMEAIGTVRIQYRVGVDDAYMHGRYVYPDTAEILLRGKGELYKLLEHIVQYMTDYFTMSIERLEKEELDRETILRKAEKHARLDRLLSQYRIIKLIVEINGNMVNPTFTTSDRNPAYILRDTLEYRGSYTPTLIYVATVEAILNLLATLSIAENTGKNIIELLAVEPI